MEHLKGNDIIIKTPTVITIGNFDGVHLGHSELINKAVSEAKKLGFKSVVYTFNPHPVFLFNKVSEKYLISTYAEKKKLIEKFNIDYYIERNFDTEFAAIKPYDFIKGELSDKLNCKMIIVGENYKFGKNRMGNADIIKNICVGINIKSVIIPSVTYGGDVVSSSRIRGLLAKGNVEEAGNILTDPYSFNGVVATGKKLGRVIGFPTINLIPHQNKLLPKDGVYFTRTFINDNKLSMTSKWFNGITNIGNNPTVDGTFRTIETHLFDFTEEIYDKEVTVYFYRFHRGEQKFDSIDCLNKQITSDKEHALEFFKESLNNNMH